MTPLLTDFYELTMAYGYWKEKMASMEAAFHLFFRKKPFGGAFALATGLETALQFLEGFHFSPSDLEYLETLRLFEPAFLAYLSTLKWSCSIDAVPEGTAVFPYEPILRVTGPIIEAQLLESLLLNTLNFQTLIATKASRIVRAAFPDPVVEFGLRRAQGVDGALSASRAAFIGGCQSTSNTLAGKLFQIPVKGTHAHSWIMAFPSEEASFAAWVRCLREAPLFLLDTYDTMRAAKRVVDVAKQAGLKTFGVRLDSGDLAPLSRQVKAIFDAAGFPDVTIMASNELDEVTIADLKRQGACINLWGVGTHLVTGQGQPALDGVYKLSAVRENTHASWIYKIKKSEHSAKVTDPGLLQVRRFPDADLIYHEGSRMKEGVLRSDPTQVRTLAGASEDLLIPVMRQGRRVMPATSLVASQQHARDQQHRFSDTHAVFLEKTVYETKQKLLQELA